MYAYVGSRTTRARQARGEGISVYRVTPAGALELVQVVGDLINPSYLTLNRAGDRLYTVHGDEQAVSAFAVDRSSGCLTLLNQQNSGGRNPVHLALAPDDRHLVVSNHLGRSLAVLPVAEDGRLEPLVQLLELQGEPGPHRQEQPHAKPHCNPFDPSGRFVLVPDKGLDRIFSFAFRDGRLVPVAEVATREGAGPRHLVCHPRLPRAYVVNELDSTLTSYAFDARSGVLDPLAIHPTLPASFTGNSRAAAIELDRSGRLLYTSNRGHDSLMVFTLDPQSGLPTPLGCLASGGRTPRAFALAPDGRQLFALNEDSDSIVSFLVDETRGILEPTGTTVRCGSPVCLVFSR